MKKLLLIPILALTLFAASTNMTITSAQPVPTPIPIFFDDCMFTGTDNTYECFCSGDGKNFFKIECRQEEFDFCESEVLGEVKRLLVVDDDTSGGSYSFDLECASISGGA